MTGSMTGKPARPRFPLKLQQMRGAPRGAADATELLRPQRPLRDAARAARHAASSHTPSGIGMDSSAVRLRMVDRLRASGVAHESVLAAFAAVPRHLFVDSALAAQAYEDTSLPIGWEQTISKPSVVARMLCLLFDGHSARLRGTLGRTLEIGTGCGYQAALLSLLSSRVLSMERIKPLHDKARESLRDWRGHDIRLVFGDGRHGHPPHAPYDSIIAAAGGDDVPAAWTDQLAEGGRLIAPTHDAASRGQTLLVIDKRDGLLHSRSLDAVHFVPLKSGTE